LDVDLAAVKPSGPHGRVKREDVQAQAERGATAPPSLPSAELPNFETWGVVKREKMSTIRRLTAEHMARSWSQVAHVTQFDIADITELEDSRKALAPRVEKAGAKLTITAIIARIVAMALGRFPKFNASIDIQAQQVVYKEYINIGIAVDTPRGLLVPVIKGADGMNATELAKAMGDLAQRARDGKIKPDEIEGGTFTITNLGSIGGTHFTPIVNWPEVAILGLGRSSMQAPACPAEGPRLMLPLSLSYDHRLIDGAEGIRFLHWIAEALEQPLLALIED
jgi:pyruvate dehydrogenase E2 component (dihydrolipoamide acetyltransferase)